MSKICNLENFQFEKFERLAIFSENSKSLRFGKF